MRFSILFMTMISTIFSMCKSAKSESEMSKEIGVYTIDRIQPEKDGETLYMTDEHGEPATMIISIPNGNYVEVAVGDQISVEIEAVMRSYPPQIIGKNIKVIKKAEGVLPSPTSDLPQYVKGELLVGFASQEVYKSTLDMLEQMEGVSLLKVLMKSSDTPIAHLKVPVDREKEYIALFEKMEGVQYAELNGIATISR